MVRNVFELDTLAVNFVTRVLAQYSIDAVLKSFEKHDIVYYFGVAPDGSNHKELKLFPTIIQYFNWRKGGLQSKLIEFTNKAKETADTIATYVKDTLEKRMLLKKCEAFTGENCSTMFGVAYFGVMSKETMCLQS